MIDNPMEKKNDLLEKHRTGKISMKELETECAYWFLDCFEVVHQKPFPSMPQDYRDYLGLPFERRQKIGNEFWQQPTIKSYLDLKNKIKNENFANLMSLKEHKQNIPIEDIVSHSKFREKISEFEESEYA